MKNKTKQPSTGKKIDYLFFFGVLALLIIGILAVASASAVYSQKVNVPASTFFYHQLLYGVGVGILFGLIAFKIPIGFLKKFSFILVLINIVLMFLVFLPACGISAGGASRWIDIGFTTIQPSEFLKLTFLLYLSAWLAGLANKKNNDRKHKISWQVSLIPFICILSFIYFLLNLQSDGSTLMVIIGSSIVMYFLAGTPFWHSLFLGGAGLVVLFVLIKFTAYRFARFMIVFESLQDPFLIKDPMGTGFQVKQALIAIGSGGLFGVGLGMANQQLGQFLPHIMSDSIFAIIAEESGFIGASVVVALFLFIFWRCLHIARETKDQFSRFFVIGVGSWLCFQSFVNIGSMIGMVPLAGIPLPFISYGGSHLLTESIAVGIVLNISKHKKA